MTNALADAKPAGSTTARVSGVLLAFAGADKPIGITEIARSTGLSKAVVHRIVQELCSTSFVWKNLQTRRYQLGMAAFALSDAVSRTSDFRRVGIELLADLAEQTGETATLSGRMGHRRVYIGQVESAQLVRISVQVGMSFPLTVGASGAAILAFLPESEVEAALEAAAGRDGTGAVADPAALRRRLQDVVARGFARSEAERIADATSFAAPVHNRIGEVIGCMSVAALTSRLTQEREEELGAAVMDAAAALSARMLGR